MQYENITLLYYMMSCDIQKEKSNTRLQSPREVDRAIQLKCGMVMN